MYSFGPNINISQRLDSLAADPSSDNWVLLAKEYIKALSYVSLPQNFSIDVFSDLLSCIDTLNYHTTSSDLSILVAVERVLWKQRPNLHSDFLDLLFETIVPLIPMDNKLYRPRLFQAFHFYCGTWSSYLDFCDWYGFDNFQDRDYIPLGRNSLAESAFIAYSRKLLSLSVTRLYIPFYIDFIAEAQSHSFTVYSNYHIASFLVAMGFNSQLILRVIRPYIKLKFTKPWSWILVANVFPDSDIRKKACIYFAVSCCGVNKPAVDNSVFSAVVDFFKRVGDFDSAHYFVDLSINSGNPIDSALSDCVSQKWYVNSRPSFSLDDLDYKSICHNIFADITDVDSNLWNYLCSDLLRLYNVLA